MLWNDLYAVLFIWAWSSIKCATIEFGLSYIKEVECSVTHQGNACFDHKYYTNNTELEAPLRGRALLIVPEVIIFTRCIVLLPWLLALFIEGCKLSDFFQRL